VAIAACSAAPPPLSPGKKRALFASGHPASARVRYRLDQRT